MDEKIDAHNFISNARREFKQRELTETDKQNLRALMTGLEQDLHFIQTDVNNAFVQIVERFTAKVPYANMKSDQLRALPEYREAVTSAYQQANLMLSSPEFKMLRNVDQQTIALLRDRNIFLESVYGEIVKSAAARSFNAKDSTKKLQDAIVAIKKLI